MSSRVTPRVGSSMDSSVYSSVSTRGTRMLRQSVRMRVQMVHTSDALDKSNASANNAFFHTPNTVARDAAKTKQFELWQAVKCDVRIKSWKVRESQLGVRVGAKRECLSELAVRVKVDRIDDETSATKRSCAIASFRSARQALDHLRGGDGQSVKCDKTALWQRTHSRRGK